MLLITTHTPPGSKKKKTTSVASSRLPHHASRINKKQQQLKSQLLPNLPYKALGRDWRDKAREAAVEQTEGASGVACLSKLVRT